MVAEESSNLRLCACGCGQAPRRARSMFVTGHHMRVAPRAANGKGALPILDRPLCACGCGQPTRKPRERFIRSHKANAAAAPPATITCTFCGREFTSANPTATYCDRVCKAAQRSQWAADSPLKKRFIAQLRARRIMGTQAAAEAGVSYWAIRAWLQNKGRILSTPNAEAIAGWLNILPQEARALQGGETVDEKRRRALHNSPKVQRHWQQLKADKRGQRRASLLGAAAIRGKPRKPVSPETRARMSQAKRQYLQRPGAYNLGEFMRTLRGRAQSILTNYRRYHSDLTPEEIAQKTIARLLQPPYNVRDEQTARALLEPKPRRKPIRRREPRRPLRCRILQELDADYPLDPKTGRRPWGALQEFERRCRAIEGADVPTYERLKEWVKDHERRCPRHKTGAAKA